MQKAGKLCPLFLYCCTSNSIYCRLLHISSDCFLLYRAGNNGFFTRIKRNATLRNWLSFFRFQHLRHNSVNFLWKRSLFCHYYTAEIIHIASPFSVFSSELSATQRCMARHAGGRISNSIRYTVYKP